MRPRGHPASRLMLSRVIVLSEGESLPPGLSPAPRVLDAPPSPVHSPFPLGRFVTSTESLMSDDKTDFHRKLHEALIAALVREKGLSDEEAEALRGWETHALAEWLARET